MSAASIVSVQMTVTEARSTQVRTKDELCESFNCVIKNFKRAYLLREIVRVAHLRGCVVIQELRSASNTHLGHDCNQSQWYTWYTVRTYV